MTFKKWYTQYRHDNIEGEPDSYTEQWIRDAWDAATRAERERCKREVMANAREHAKAGLGLEAMAIRDVANALDTEERE